MKTQLTLVLVLFGLTQFSFGQKLRLDEKIHVLEQQHLKHPNDIKTVIELSDAYQLNSTYYRSLNLLKKFIHNHPKLSSKDNAQLFLGLAKTYKFLDKNGLANLNFLKSSDAFIAAKDFEGYLRCGIEQIEFSRRTRRFEEGVKHYYYYSHFAKKQGISTPKIWIGLYNRFAAILNEYKGQHEASIRYSRLALKLAQSTGDKNNSAVSYNEIGYSFSNLQQQDSALTAYQNAALAYSELNYTREYVHVWYNILSLEMKYNRVSIDQQIKNLWNIAHYIDSANVDYYKTEVYHALRTLYFKKGDYRASCEADFIYEKNLTKEFQRIQNQKLEEVAAHYQNEELQNENKRISEKEQSKAKELQFAKTENLMFIIVLVIVVSALIGLYYLLYKLRKTNTLLLKRNEQKTTLVQEIHHRVKNNLQFVRSMLELQTNSTESEAEAESLSDVSRRISAMSLVHEMLYLNSENLGLSLKDYIEELVNYSADTFPPQTPVTFRVAVVDREVPIDKLVAIGVICSELFTNSVKHAFVSTEEPVITVSIGQNSDQQLEMTVSDNGKEEEMHSKRHNLGMRLIDIFARQLNGNYSIDRNEGYTFRMIFPI